MRYDLPRLFFELLSLPQVTTAVSLPPCVGCDVENRLRHATQRIRVSEFFKDYDPLRTGFITSEQLKMKLKLKICTWPVYIELYIELL